MWQGAKSETGLIYYLLLQALKPSAGAALVTLCEIDDQTLLHTFHNVLLLLEVKLLLFTYIEWTITVHSVLIFLKMFHQKNRTFGIFKFCLVQGVFLETIQDYGDVFLTGEPQ